MLTNIEAVVLTFRLLPSFRLVIKSLLIMVLILAPVFDTKAWVQTCPRDKLSIVLSPLLTLLGKTLMPMAFSVGTDSCATFVDSIIQETAIIVSDGSFNIESLVGPVGSSALALAPYIDYDTNIYVKGNK